MSLPSTLKEGDLPCGRPGAAQAGVDKLMPGSKRLLGGQILGRKGAVHRIDALAVAITMGVTTEQLGMLDFAYAPPFSRTWDALNVAGNVAK